MKKMLLIPNTIKNSTICHAVLFIAIGLLINVSTLSAVKLIAAPECYEGQKETESPLREFLFDSDKEVYMASFKIHEQMPPEEFVLKLLRDLVKSGRQVHFLTENKLTEMEKQNLNKGFANTYQKYVATGVTPYSSTTEKIDELVHVKFFVTDRGGVVVGNTNFAKDPTGCIDRPKPRDFAICIDRNPELAEELITGFHAIVNGQSFIGKHPNLLWGPLDQRKKLTKMIDTAKKRIYIYQQDITDEKMVDHIVQACQRGVDVQIIMSPFPFGTNKPDNNIPNQEQITLAGGKVFLNDTINVHAKVLIIDNQMYLGSTNFYQPSIDSNVNVGILVDNQELIDELLIYFVSDKKNAHLMVVQEQSAI